MKILINTANLKIGGGLQVTDSVVRELPRFKQHQFVVILSPKLNKLAIDMGDAKNIVFYEMESYPNNLLKGRKMRKVLKEIEKHEKPRVVFSVFGPTYWTPIAPHLMGYAIPHYVYKDSPFFKTIGIKTAISLYLIELVHTYFIKRNAQFFVTETVDVKNRLASSFSFSPENIFTVSNYHHQIFNDFEIKEKYEYLRNSKDKIILTISAYYPHKNLNVIKGIINSLKGKKAGFKFVLTISQESFDKNFKGYEEYIHNIGPVPIEDCPTLYSYAHAMLLPTLLECFSASYVEAMKMKVPILTSNLSFAKDICQDAALYFDPVDPNDILEKIEALFSNKELYHQLLESGVKRLSNFNNYQERAEKYIEICENIATR